MRNNNNDIDTILVVTHDVTQRKKEESFLRLLESVVTNTNDAVMLTEAEPFDEPGPRIVYVNEAFTKMTGYTSEEAIGKSPRILQGPKTSKEELRKLRKAMENWEYFETTVVNYKKMVRNIGLIFQLNQLPTKKVGLHIGYP